jgi:hypothetical protein
MAYNSSRLPNRFPVGTKFVIESHPGRDGQVYSRFLEFPDGTLFPLPVRKAQRKSSASASARRAARPRGKQPAALTF